MNDKRKYWVGVILQAGALLAFWAMILAMLFVPISMGCDDRDSRTSWHSDIHNRGYRSGLVGAEALANPYHAAQPAEVWLDGWIKGKAERELKIDAETSDSTL